MSITHDRLEALLTEAEALKELILRIARETSYAIDAAKPTDYQYYLSELSKLAKVPDSPRMAIERHHLDKNKTHNERAKLNARAKRALQGKTPRRQNLAPPAPQETFHLDPQEMAELAEFNRAQLAAQEPGPTAQDTSPKTFGPNLSAPQAPQGSSPDLSSISPEALAIAQDDSDADITL